MDHSYTQHFMLVYYYLCGYKGWESKAQPVQKRSRCFESAAGNFNSAAKSFKSAASLKNCLYLLRKTWRIMSTEERAEKQ
uniref:Uncharacterized protein n=1 Tax=Romanomermis culicivorax TaxID=13658 RepID=A0A915IT77_ROMCU